jgi:hypothetical protein
MSWSLLEILINYGKLWKSSLTLESFLQLCLWILFLSHLFCFLLNAQLSSTCFSIFHTYYCFDILWVFSRVQMLLFILLQTQFLPPPSILLLYCEFWSCCILPMLFKWASIIKSSCFTISSNSAFKKLS